MTVHYNVPGKERKNLAQTIGTWLEEDVKYAGAPTFAYLIGGFTIDKDGNLSAEAVSDDTVERLLEHLTMRVSRVTFRRSPRGFPQHLPLTPLRTSTALRFPSRIPDLTRQPSADSKLSAKQRQTSSRRLLTPSPRRSNGTRKNTPFSSPGSDLTFPQMKMRKSPASFF